MPTSNYRADLTAAAQRAAAQASARWTAAATASRRGGRIVAAATLAWDASYPIAHEHGYRTLADRAATAFADLHQRLRDASGTRAPAGAAVAPLARIARTTRPSRDAGGPPPRAVLESAAVAALDRLDGRTAPDAITDAVHRQAVRYGAMQGALAAAADIHARWHARADLSMRSLSLDGTTLDERVNAILVQLNCDVVTTLLNDVTAPARGAPQLARTSFAAPAITGSPATAEIGDVQPHARRPRQRGRS